MLGRTLTSVPARKRACSGRRRTFRRPLVLLAAAAVAASVLVFEEREAAASHDRACGADAGISCPVPTWATGNVGFYLPTADVGDTWIRLRASTSGGSVPDVWYYQIDGSVTNRGDTDCSPQPANSDYTRIASTSGHTLNHVVTGLTNGTKYRVYIQSGILHNGHYYQGEAPNFCRLATPTLAAPPAPTGVTAAAGDEKVTLGGSVLTGSVDKWQYQYKTDGSYGSWTDITNATTTLNNEVTGLTNGTAYTFKVRAVNSQGNGTASSEVSATPASAAAGATNLRATRGNASVTLRASITDTGGSAITKWQYQQKDTGAYGTWTDIASSNSATLNATISSGVSNGTAYTFKVRAVNSIGNGADSNEASAEPSATAATAPAAPTDLTATRGNASVTLRANTSDTGGSTITKWQYQQKTTGAYGSWTDIANMTTTLNHTVSSLTNGTVYTFRVRVVNDIGNSANSNEVSMAPSTTAAGAPAKPSLTATGANTRVTLTASITDDGGSTVTKWQYAQKDAGAYGSWTDIANMTNSLSHTVTSLTNDTVYTFKVRAVNDYNNDANDNAGPDSDEVTATPTATAPAASTDLAAASGDQSVTLTASISDNGGSAVTGWEVEQDGSGTWTSLTDTDADANELSGTVTGLTNGTSYAFKVRAVNAIGSGAESNEATATPLGAPRAPTLTAAAGNASVNLTAAITDDGASAVTGWEVEQDDSGTWTSLTDTDADANELAATVSNLTNGTAYSFKVRAVNAVGSGAESNAASATPATVAVAPTLTATSGNASVTLTASISDDGGNAVTGWEISQDGGSYTAVTNDTDATANGLSSVVTGLTNGTAYSFKVRAVNAVGSGTESNSVTVTPSTAPAKPATPTAVIGNASVTITASISDDGGSPVTGWKISQDGGGYTAVANDTDATANGLSTVVTGLTNGTSYSFKVRAVNSAGDGAESDAVSAVPGKPPEAPTLTVTPRNVSVKLNATVTEDGGYDVTKWQYAYKATVSAEYGAWTDIRVGDALVTGSTLTDFSVAGLRNGFLHTFKVRAVNSIGIGVESNEQTARPALSLPEKPTFTATGRDQSVVLDASITDDGGSLVSSWQYRQKLTSASDYASPWVTVPSSEESPSTFSHRVRNLSNGTSYTFKVRAVNSVGNGVESDEASATPGSSVPAKPTNVSAEPMNAQIVLNATLDDDGGRAVTRWEYRQKLASDSDYTSDWVTVTATPGSRNSFSHPVFSVTNGTSYTFKVRAVNSVGNGVESDEVMARPRSAPPAPSVFTVTPGATQATMNAALTSNGGAPIVEWQYRHKRADGNYPQNWTAIPASAGTNVTHIVYNLVTGTEYVFQIRAVNIAGVGEFSGEVNATTTGQAPTTPPPTTPPPTGGGTGGGGTGGGGTGGGGTGGGGTGGGGTGGGGTGGGGTGGGTGTTTPPPNAFNDDDGHVHEEAINKVAAAGITQGCDDDGTAFCPDRNVRRDEMASFLARAFNLPVPTDDSVGAFTDIAGNPHAVAIRAVAGAGITLGCTEDGTMFCPADPVTRDQMASFLARALKLSVPTDPNVGRFEDIVGNPHADDIRAIAAEGITNGCNTAGTLYCPYTFVTRGQMASFLARALKL